MSDLSFTTGTRPSWLNRAVPGLIAGTGALAIAVWNPGDSGVTMCASKLFLGFDCPACGGLRTVNSLMRGDLLGALDHNVILAVALPIITVVWLAWFLGPLFNRDINVPRAPRWFVIAATVVVASFTIARNVGGPTWAQWLASGTFG